ncbi:MULTISPECIES: Crp/Fnr family transcriptional regulator [Flavobacterium]|jgi:CRP-like cAMP-binding protein|uniref:Crp/Fnr family transcriptional regulator n=1 Tax=Flavobacterium TaxID=237 RepID=UPI0024A9A4A3|nr:Crp/Fnr family transcriptional regulator [Flavobacterium yafengii]MDI6046893.1 Crp/Fnr family transcriptional regulator [Flavobacterium yafengii]
MNEKVLLSSAEPLLEYFRKRGYILNDLEKSLVQENFHSRLYRKRQYVLQDGDVCTQFNFVVRGCLRTYNVDKKGNLHILQFGTENNWINDLGSFHGMKPSNLNIDALEDTVVLQIGLDDLIFLYKQSPIFDRIFRVLIENGYIHLQERLLQNISSTAEERYEAFLERYPHLINRISQVQIAAFMGVTPEFLSRLRNQRTKASQNS